MKSSLLIITILFCLNVNAQIKKGATLLGGNIGFFNQSDKPNTSSNSHNSNSSLIVAPFYGKAIKQNLVLGFDVVYQYQRFFANDTSKYKINLYGADILIRKYKPLGHNFYLFGESTFGGNLNNRKLKNFNSVIKTDEHGFGFQVTFTPGISYSINNHLQLETKFYSFLSAAYTHTKFINVPPGYSPYILNTISFNSNLSSLSNFIIGLRVLINH